MTDDQKFLLAPILVLMLEACEFFAVRREGSDVFSPKLLLRLFHFTFTTTMLGGCLLYFSHGLGTRGPKDPPGWLFPVAFVAFLLSPPRTLASNATGLSVYTVYGFRRRFLAWSDVASVTSEWTEDPGPFRGLPRFMGYNIYVRGRDGSQMVHSVSLRRQARFLDVLREHVPARAWALGLHDWHPERT